MKFKLILAVIAILLISAIFISGETTMHELTKGLADTLYCQLTGCTMTGNLNMGGNSIVNATNITVTIVNATEFTGEYWVNESGDNMTGNLFLTNGTPITPTHAPMDGEDVFIQGTLEAGVIYSDNGIYADGDVYAGATNVLQGGYVTAAQSTSTLADLNADTITADNYYFGRDNEYDVGTSSERARDVYIARNLTDGSDTFPISDIVTDEELDNDTIIRTGNTSWIEANEKYVNETGDTMTGNLTFSTGSNLMVHSNAWAFQVEETAFNNYGMYFSLSVTPSPGFQFRTGVNAGQSDTLYFMNANIPQFVVYQRSIISPTIQIIDLNNKALTFNKNTAGFAYMRNNNGSIYMQPSNDINDYLIFDTVNNIPRIDTAANGNGDLNISAAGGDIFFEDVNVNIDYDLDVGKNLTGNLIYAQMGDRFPTGSPFTVTFTDIGVYYNVTNLTTTKLNGFSYTDANQTHGGSYLTADVAGTYMSSAHFSGAGSAAGGDYGIVIAKNFDKTLTEDNCYVHAEGTGDTDVYTINCLIELAIGDTVNVQVEDEADPTKSIEIHSHNVVLKRIGD